ncbi:MAG: YkgJ family cysteine cluster protein [Gammaproteobacteria bacterium]|nr:YkgJ family cysteine cluster protein [Gammaproteobacteria bacterium]
MSYEGPHIRGRFPPIKVEVDTRGLTEETKCDACTKSLCCHYITQQIETPRSRYDFDFLLWQMTHKNVQAFKDEDGWFLLFITTCRFLQHDGRCGIYEKRPQVCRDHKNDWCELDEPLSKHWDLYFPDYEALDEYCRKRFKTWDRRHDDWAKDPDSI